MNRTRTAVALLTIVLCSLSIAGGRAQPVFTGPEIFPLEEFAARRARVMASIGDAIAVVQGDDRAAGRAAAPAEQSVLLPLRHRRAARDPRRRRPFETHDGVSAAAGRSSQAPDRSHVWSWSRARRRSGAGDAAWMRRCRATSSRRSSKRLAARRGRSTRPSAKRSSAARRPPIRRRSRARRRMIRGTGAARAKKRSSPELKATAPPRRSRISIPFSTSCGRSRARARSRSMREATRIAGARHRRGDARRAAGHDRVSAAG